jgi:hypothetical protein
MRRIDLFNEAKLVVKGHDDAKKEKERMAKVNGFG